VDSYCSSLADAGGACVLTFGAAQSCAAWAPKSNILIAKECGGFAVVHNYVVDTEALYLYDESTGNLAAILFASGGNGLTCVAGATNLLFQASCETGTNGDACVSQDGGASDAASA
jgi:hypothetical protein